MSDPKDVPQPGEEAFWAKLNGRSHLDMSPEEIAEVEALVPELPPYVAATGGRGADPNWLRLVSRRKHLVGKLDPHKRGGKARTKLNRAEVEEQALQRLMPRALKVLDEQLDSPDDRVRQSAAIKVMEYVKGKPTQKVEAQVDQIQRIVYESAAYRPPSRAEIQAEVIEDAEILELPPADETASLSA